MDIPVYKILDIVKTEAIKNEWCHAVEDTLTQYLDITFPYECGCCIPEAERFEVKDGPRVASAPKLAEAIRHYRNKMLEGGWELIESELLTALEQLAKENM